MNILVTGSSGFVGSAIIPVLKGKGHEIKRLVRAKKGHSDEILWTPPDQGPDPAALEGIDAVIHLAGESISSRWTDKRKQAIRESRGKSTRVLVDALVRMKTPPKILISASAIGYYGNHGDEIVRDGDAPGSDFLASVCREWEAATEQASQKGIRVVNLRFGIILSSEGGALGKMLTPFKMGLGGKIATGRQYMSWIAMDEVIQVILFVLSQNALQGPMNTVAPKPVTNEEFTKTLGRVLQRPTVFPMPAFAARLAFGEMADALLIGGVRVEPAKLARSGYSFRYPDLEVALRHILKN
jgi:uncharacterized protein